jgi:hypothetical protein
MDYTPTQQADQSNHKGHFEVPLPRKTKTNHAKREHCKQTTILGRRLSLGTIIRCALFMTAINNLLAGEWGSTESTKPQCIRFASALRA